MTEMTLEGMCHVYSLNVQPYQSLKEFKSVTYMSFQMLI
jgi:hypothetical protein